MGHRMIARAAALGLAIGMVGSSAVYAQTLRVANLAGPPNKGDPTVSIGYQHGYAYEALFDALTSVGDDGKPTPRLAASWTNVDPTTWRFVLAPNVKFHAGTAFNADAIVAAVKNLQSDDQKKFGASVYGSIRHIVEATKIDDMTVLIKTDRAAPILPNEISAFRIVDPKAWTDLGRDKFGATPSGTGPFRITSWADETKFEAVKFDNGPRKPKTAGMLMYFMPEAPTRVQAFQSGAVDITLNVAPDAAGLVKSAGGSVNVGPSPSVLAALILMSKGGFTTDKRVRQAMNLAVDKSYTQTLLGGFNQPSGQPAASSINGYQADIKPYAYDPDRAKKLLAEAGYPNGFKMMLEVNSNDAALGDVMQKVAQDLTKVGIVTELRLITVADMMGRLNGTKPYEGELSVFNFGSQPSMDMMRPINAYYNCEATQKWMCIPAAEPLIKQANSEFDAAKRSALLRQISQLYHEEAPVLYLYEQTSLDGVAAKVKNFKNMNWIINWHDVTLAN